MNKIIQSGATLTTLLLSLAMLCFSPATLAQIDVLDAIDVQHSDDYSLIKIHLNIPVQYKSHVPETSGDVLRIRVTPVLALGAEGDVLFGDEFLQWSPDDKVPLSEVTYNSSGLATTNIILQFEEVVEFEVVKSPDVRVLVIKIKHPATRAREKRLKSLAYAINLASSTTPFTADEIPQVNALLSYRLYTTRFQKNGETWTRLRLGFFSSKQEARSVLNSLQSYYPGAWIVAATSEEQRKSAASIVGDRRAVVVPAPAPVPVPDKKLRVDKPGEIKTLIPGSVTSEETDKIAALMKQANGLMTDKDYDSAVRLYTKILQFPENARSRDALEFLGLARERKGQLAHAKAVYRDYLDRYPDGEDAERVKQRLAGLVTAAKAPKGKLAAAKGRRSQASMWDVFGGFSQFFRRDENTSGIDDDNEITTVTQKSLSSDLDITGRLRKSNYDLRTRFTGGYLYDFLDDGDNETTVSSIYFNARNTDNNMSMRLGRQSRSTGGVLGRFDGLLLDLPLTQKTAVSLVGGFPVDSSRDGFNEARYFYGAGIEFEDFLTGWDANAFVIEQIVDSITDRRAVGGELRYFDANRSLFTLVDYDIFYNTLNTAQLLGNWTSRKKTTVNIVLDYRNSPILTTSNALQGEPVFLSIEDMLTGFTEDQIYGFAQDRTATSKLATVGLTRPVSAKLQVSGDITLSRLSDTVASGNVTVPNPGTDNEFFYNFQLIGSNLIKEGDITIAGLRFIDATTSDTVSLSLNTRYPVTSDFRINPRFRIDFRKNLTDDTEQYIFRPSARITWRVKRRFRLEAELGGEWSDREIVSGSTSSRSYFLSLGYRADF